MEQLAGRLADKLIKWNIVKLEDRELYECIGFHGIICGTLLY